MPAAIAADLQNPHATTPATLDPLRALTSSFDISTPGACEPSLAARIMVSLEGRIVVDSEHSAGK